MNIKEIKLMINLMNENNLTELEVEQEGIRLCLKKGSGGEITVEPASAAQTPASVRPTPHSAPSAASAQQQAQAPTSATEIKAPMVGTFYRAPSPEAPPFVKINDEIEIGQIICVIEAMKLMNEIKAEVTGKIVDILVDNAEPVEFGQPLFLIEPS